MIKKNKLSLSTINSFLLISFLAVITIAILISTYVNTEKIVDKNINDYFNQTHNLSNVIIDNEYNFLHRIINDISHSLNNKKDLNNLSETIDSIDSIDEVDLLFFKTKSDVLNYSNSLFDSELLLDKILNKNIREDNTILSIEVNEENFLLMLSFKKIIDSKTGRVNAIIYAAKIFNDNFTLLNKIKQKAKLEDVYMFFENKMIAATNKNTQFNSDIFNEKLTVVKDKLIFANKFIEIDKHKYLDIIYVSSNTTFDVLKNSFIKYGVFLLIFVIFAFLILQYLSNKFMIKPFSRLLKYAHNTKEKENSFYEDTHVLEFDEFAYELKDIITELRKVKEQYSRAIDGVQDGLWDIDIKTKKIFLSNRFLEMLGYKSYHNINKISFLRKIIHKDDYALTMAKLKAHLNSKTDLFDHEYRLKCRDGNYKWIKVRGKLFFDGNTPIQMTGFHTDINDLISLQNENKEKEQMLYQQSKLASMGDMIGNIAHQWRQPLTVISVIASGISMRIDTDKLNKEDAKEDIKELLKTVQYLSSVIDNFRNFFKPNNVKENFTFGEIIQENKTIFESSYKPSGIEFITNIEDVNIYGYKFELMQVIINLINNSKDAISARLESNEDRFIFLDCKEEDKNIIIKAYDNAGGIDASFENKIYEPYFTTKHKSQGTGLGLYMSSEIIQKHFNGVLSNKTIEFEYDGKSYKGEEFTINIPIEE